MNGRIFDLRRFVAILTLTAACCAVAFSSSRADDAERSLFDRFSEPDDVARPGVFWFFLDANLSKEGMEADLRAMKRMGVSRAISMEAALGGPRGTVEYLTDEWLDCWKHASNVAQELGIELAAAVGPGWCGAGGPWIDPDHSMQHLRASVTKTTGGSVDLLLPVPEPRDPYFGRGSLGPCLEDWKTWYRDVAVVAFPTPDAEEKITDWEEKALFFRPPYSSQPNVKPYLLPDTDFPNRVERLKNSVVPYDSIVDITDKMDADGRLKWDAPEGNWTILRLGRRLTGQTSRPAPKAGLGLESDKFEKSGIELHFKSFDDKLLDVAKYSTIHHDSWEMSSQNWSEHFREHFIEKRGYDPIRWTPAMFGIPVESVEQTERFLWDLRRVAQELVYENNVMRMKELAADRGLNFSSEVYDLNPAGDLYLFRAADIPMCEFWAEGYGFETSFSVVEATSSAHVTGKPIVASESFTTGRDMWRQHPGRSKRQGDWALCSGVNKIHFHRMCSQPNDDAPGLSLGIHGMHFDRTETWAPLADAYCGYLARVQSVLQQGTVSADVLFLDQEDAPAVFEAPSSAFMPMTDDFGESIGNLKDKYLYNFDACCPQSLLDDAKAVNGKVVFPSGASYSLLVLPKTSVMTVELAEKILELVEGGVKVIGNPPSRTPTMVNYPENDARLKELVQKIWTHANAPVKVKYGALDAASSREILLGASWIWSDDEWRKVPAHVTKSFRKTFNLPTDKTPEEFQALVADAVLLGAADNKYAAYLNGELAGEWFGFNEPGVHSVAKFLRPGENELVIKTTNTEAAAGDVPTPAGLIAALQCGSDAIVTDGSWQTLPDGEGDATPVVVLGASGMSPWNFKTTTPFDRDSTYPHWNSIVNVMQNLGIAPDFRGSHNIRWIHKFIDGCDVYYVANRSARKDRAVCAAEFRTTGKFPELWDPATCKRYALDAYIEREQTTFTHIPLDYAQSFFVVFTPDKAEWDRLPKASRTIFASTSEQIVMDLSNDWDVEFCQNASSNRNFESGKARKLHFDSLIDWAKSDDPGVKYYSGLATYEKTFDLPEERLTKVFVDGKEFLRYEYELGDDAVDYVLDLYDVQVMARVEFNGRDLGTLWVAPWRIVLPKDLVKPHGNTLKITVANLWCNRLIGDASLPVEQRFTRTSNPMWGADDKNLQPSGITSHATIMKRVNETLKAKRPTGKN